MLSCPFFRRLGDFLPVFTPVHSHPISSSLSRTLSASSRVVPGQKINAGETSPSHEMYDRPDCAGGRLLFFLIVLTIMRSASNMLR